ncbi:DNA-directed DNA polymerase gamma mip1 [Coemansia javaensis]|uniref:DNA-directed DNA polymerase n=1 Tax=Coemansia javaensis TaxID=2761396 RepID=A0A9W8HMW2_9FUNG|nr:DNA-directed DNA polymerase gamma mip1 [Coemansia javaensis]
MARIGWALARGIGARARRGVRAHSAAAQAQSGASVASGPRRNELDIVMLAPRLRRSVFGEPRLPVATAEQTRVSVDHLKAQGIYGKAGEPVDMSDFDPPELLGGSIEEHFQRMGELAAQPYLGIAQAFARLPDEQFPPVPRADAWVMQAGWTRYGRDGTRRRVAAPDAQDDVLVFDVEVIVRDSPYPALAAAASRSAWYLWVSPYLAGDSAHPRHLVPLTHAGQARQPRLVIGHNVAYDRARVQEERLLKRRALAFVDTMSLHVSSGGLCTRQRLSWMRYLRAKKENDVEYLRLNADTGKFFDVSSLNSLKEVAHHYCGIQLSKDQRDTFVHGTLADVRADFAQLAAYCAGDVDVTRRVYAKVFAAFEQKCPHPASFAGMLTMMEGYLPVDRSWPEYIARSERLVEELAESVGARLRQLAEDALRVAAPMDDPWLRSLDWTVEPQKFTKPRLKADGSFAKNGEPRPYAKQLLPGRPKWYRDLWCTKQKRIRLTVRTRAAPYLLRLKWLGYPLHHSAAHGWTFRVPRSEYEGARQPRVPALKNMRPLAFPADPADPGYERIPAEDARDAVYFKVPHPDGEAANCGSPLAKSYQAAIEDGTLSSEYPMAREAVEMNAMCSYWISARERVRSQFVVWGGEAQAADGRPLALGLPGGAGRGVILPLVVPMGTVTRRGVEPTWMTASNAKRNRVGSELKAMVRCPEGYRFVGADVDSEELWISALIGDSQFRQHGATAFGWMTLQGTKAAGTDLHSNTARILGIDRGSAKVFNYGRIYGAGVKYATTLLQQFNPDMTAAAAQERAERLYAATKGASMRSRRAFGRPFWHGGTESYMFNQLEAFATADDPRTPALGCGITDALRKSAAGDRFMTSRINWVVQSSGVDYLHMLLVAVQYLARRYHIDLRFAISVHDEVRYIVAERDVHRAALALQVANLWVRAMFSSRLGIEDLPQSVAFFSAVDVDRVLRKEVDMPCVTPTNPDPVPPGQSFTIAQTLAHTAGGSLAPARALSPADFTLSDNHLPLAIPDAGSTSPPPPPPQLAAPDPVWLTAQMLGSTAEVSMLLSATQSAKGRDAKPAAPRTTTRRIAPAKGKRKN